MVFLQKKSVEMETLFSAIFFTCVIILGHLADSNDAHREINLHKLGRQSSNLEDKKKYAGIDEYHFLDNQESKLDGAVSDLESAPAGTLNNPMKVEFDKRSVADLTKDDKVYSYFDDKFSDQFSQTDDRYSGYFVLTRQGYQYESIPTNSESHYGDIGNTETLKFWNNAIRNLPVYKSPKSIFLPDTREVIADTSIYPYSAIGVVESGCTGAFVGPRHVLTAAHCLYSPVYKRWRGNLNIKRAKNCNPNQGYYHSWKYAIISRGWLLFGLPAYNYAIIVVNEPSPFQIGFTWLKSIPEVPVSVNGYPGDKSGKCMWGSWCELVWKSKHQLGHNCDTYYGMSGSPVFAKEETTGNTVVYCVHAYGGGYFQKFNKCIRITESKYNLIKTWVDLY